MLQCFLENPTERLTMRVLLLNRNTGLYFQGREQWVNAAAQALDFKSTADALVAVTELRLQNMDIVLSFDDPTHDLRLPVDDERRPI
jgi:hypothetical protein